MNKASKYKHQQGVVLIIALILIVVMSVVAVASVRLAGVDELVNNNTRSKVLAFQAAETASNFCRQQIFNSNTMKIIPIPSDEPLTEGKLWGDMTQWANTANINVLPDTELGTLVSYTKKPECLIEDISDFVTFNTPSDDSPNKVILAYKITARGFSPNYQVESEGFQKAGAQAWIQIVVTRTQGGSS